VHSMRRGRPAPGEDAVVLGAGGVGAFLTYAAARAGARVTVFDVLPERLELARALGASETLLPEDGVPLAEALRERGVVARVVYAGLGRMGVPMARNLARAGLLGGVYNRTRTTADELAREVGARSCATPAELAAGVNVLVTMVADDHASTELYAGGDGFLEAL